MADNHDWDWEELESFDGVDSSSFSCSDVIRSNYFSIETPSPNPKHDSFSESDATASWMDPGQFSGQRRRNSDSSDSSLSTPPHSDHNYKEGDDGNGSGLEFESSSNLLSDSEFGESGNSEIKEIEMMNTVDSHEKKSSVWWKEVVKYCVFRVSPLWSFSVVAVALMGFVLYRRRLISKMKRKTQGIQLNLTVDDKKVSQFKSRVARLNEVFSVVKRVPIVRPSLPAQGFAQWPVVSFR